MLAIDRRQLTAAVEAGRRRAADDAIVIVTPAETEALIRHAAAAGFAVREDVRVARRHAGRLDIPYLERTLRPICELAADMVPWSRLQRVLAAVRSPDA